VYARALRLRVLRPTWKVVPVAPAVQPFRALRQRVLCVADAQRTGRFVSDYHSVERPHGKRDHRGVAIRVLRVYHGGRDPDHRARERALAAAGVDITLVVPRRWPDAGAERCLSPEEFRVVELAVRRPGDVNRHAHRDGGVLRRLIEETRPDVLDIHEEPFSVTALQGLRAAPGDLPVVMYTAQNIDKRLPPPFARYERAAHRRVGAFYPCTCQAASVVRGKGFTGTIEVLPLGYDDTVFSLGSQSLDSDEIVLMLVGRLVPEKGAADAVRVLARVNSARPARLIVNGEGPEELRVRELAASLGVSDRVELRGWQPSPVLASTYRTAHVVLMPSSPTTTWAEQFGRVIVEAQASGAVVAGYGSGSVSEVAGAGAVIVPIGDVEELASRVAAVVSDPGEFALRRAAGSRQNATRTWQVVAARQVAIYHAVTANERAVVDLPRSPRQRRASARGEFGATASTPRGARPFSLPVLRRGGHLADAIARVIDVTAEFVARLLQ
jgi:glycosyltransferase involved in cell wall biosynthesis